MTLSLIATTSPTLSTGAFDTVFGEYEKVVYAQVMFDNPEISDYVLGTTVSISGVTVTVTVKKVQLSAANTWGAADTADVSGETFVVVADCI